MIELCASESVSVALKPFGYPPHGHDVELEACWLAAARIDIEALASILREVSSHYDHKALWEIFGEEGMIEDLLAAVARELRERSPPGAQLTRVEGRWRGRRISLILNL